MRQLLVGGDEHSEKDLRCEKKPSFLFIMHNTYTHVYNIKQ